LGGVGHTLPVEPTLTGLNNNYKKIDSKKKFFQPKESRVIGLHSTRMETYSTLSELLVVCCGHPSGVAGGDEYQTLSE